MRYLIADCVEVEGLRTFYPRDLEILARAGDVPVYDGFEADGPALGIARNYEIMGEGLYAEIEWFGPIPEMTNRRFSVGYTLAPRPDSYEDDIHELKCVGIVNDCWGS